MAIIQAAKKVFSNRKYIALFFAVSAIAVGLYVFYQVKAVPGNDLAFQLSITPWWGFLLMAVFAASTGLLVTMNVFVYKNFRKVHVKETGGTVLGSATGFIASIFSSATCASCVSALFGFLGTGTVFLLLDYRWHVLAASIAITGIALHFSSKKINNECRECKI